MLSIRINKIIAIIFAFLLAMGFVFAGGRNNKDVIASESLKTLQEPDTMMFEKYEMKVLIDAKWGSGPGEFGKIDNIEGPSTGPSAFTVSSDGCIYVLDNINKRVQKFDTQGKFLYEVKYTEFVFEDSKEWLKFAPFALAVDDESNIYLLGAILPSAIGRVQKYNSGNKLCLEYKEIPIEKLDVYTKALENLKGKTEEIFRMSTDIFTFWQSLKLTVQNSEVVLNNISIGTTTMEYTEKKVLSPPRLIVPASSHAIKKDKKLIVSLVKVEDRDTIKLLLPEAIADYSVPRLLKIDKKGDIFLMREIYGSYDWQEEWLKYNSNGELLARMNIMPKETYEWVGDFRVITDEGSVYYWGNDENGIKIIQFIKQ